MSSDNGLTTLRKKAFEHIVGKGENAGNQHFLLFPQFFSALLRKKKLKGPIALILSSANALVL